MPPEDDSPADFCVQLTQGMNIAVQITRIPGRMIVIYNTHMAYNTGETKIVVAADIHGCLQEFQDLLVKAGFNEKQDVFVFLGDAVDRGPESRETAEYLRAMKDRMAPKQVRLLLGNHEWRYRQRDPAFFDRHFRDWDMFYRTEACIYVHAGWSENEKERTRELLLEDRSILAGYPQLRNYGIPVSSDQILYIPPARPYRGPLFIAGHSPVKDPVYIDGHQEVHILADETWYPRPERGSLFIDTGCYMGGRLSALVIAGDRIKTISIPYRYTGK